ncbi:MAG: 3-phosphoshikimate 1-carboxyvinyltransferase [Pelagibacteraceae bacterium]|jgi:3-phosphoshikimate 1-carboxyvinyltransferase|nr:3-phosphoshikimate 1-carboxyvinyltransferase [Pelagibacteraceae bacterium]
MLNKSFSLLVSKGINSYNKIIRVDSDKSISIRSFLIGSISHNITEVKNVLESFDVFSCIDCLRKLGVKIIKIKAKHYLIHGKGLGSFYAKKNTILNCGNSGTTARLLVGLLSTNPGIQIKIKGDHSLNKRNMRKLIELMSEFGATFLPRNKNNFPLTLISSEIPLGIKYMAGVSAQLKSAAMLAGLNANGVTNIVEVRQSRNHTENMLLQSTSVLKIKKNKKKENHIKIFGKNYLNPLKINVGGDPSSAAFFTALTLLTPHSSLKIKNVGLNSRRIGFYNLLKKHGAKIKFKNIKNINHEKIGDIEIHSSKLKAINANPTYYVSATDEYPILFVVAALTKGTSIFKGIEDLANKESNRIEEMRKILKQIGVKCVSSKNEMKIFGKTKIKKTDLIRVPNLGDHRICMSTVILSLLTGVKAKIKNFETVRTSSPSFLHIIKSLGGKFEIKKTS